MRHKDVKVKDIADRLGISQSTVSKALHNASDISDYRRRQILDTAVEMGYVVRSSQKEKNRKLAVLLREISYENENDPGFELVRGFQQAALRDVWGMETLNITPEDETKERYDSYLISHGYLGGFMVGFTEKDPWYRELMDAVTPAVLLDSYLVRNNVCEVCTDTGEAVRDAMDYLVGLGHRRIAFWNGPIDLHISQTREDAFLQSVLGLNLNAGECPIIHSDIRDADPDYLGQLITSILHSGTTAIFCHNDETALYLLDAFSEKGIKVPGDISIMGFDDIFEAKNSHPPLTTMRQDRNLLGQAAFFALTSLISGIRLNRSTVRAELMVRGTTGPV
ncbi:MAG: LacI family DNA-binding transcriptional regulator [Lachnospiraceae bacterium]|nr:LacI family DNA-binding transcriptional regulator [Lachnospiraceae bacterium]